MNHRDKRRIRRKIGRRIQTQFQLVRRFLESSLMLTKEILELSRQLW